MLRFVLKRVALAVVTLWILSVIVFLAAQVLPGDPGRSILGPLADPHAVDVLDHQLGVDRPILSQYWTWISHFVQGNPGTVLPVPVGHRPDAHRSARAVPEAGRAGLHPGRSAGHPGRGPGRTQRRAPA